MAFLLSWNMKCLFQFASTSALPVWIQVWFTDTKRSLHCVTVLLSLLLSFARTQHGNGTNKSPTNCCSTRFHAEGGGDRSSMHVIWKANLSLAIPGAALPKVQDFPPVLKLCFPNCRIEDQAYGWSTVKALLLELLSVYTFQKCAYGQLTELPQRIMPCLTRQHY